MSQLRTTVVLLGVLLLASPLAALASMGHEPAPAPSSSSSPPPTPGPSQPTAYQPPAQQQRDNGSSSNASGNASAPRVVGTPLPAGIADVPPVAGIASGRPQEWAAFKGDGERTGATPAHLPSAPVLRWQSGARDAGGILASPSVGQGLVVFASLDKRVYAVDAASGIEHWHWDAGALLFASPALSDGLAVIATLDGRLVALDLVSGAATWSTSLNGTTSASPAIVNGVVYEATENGRILALNLSDGHVRWNRTLPALNSQVSPVVSGGRVMIGDARGTVWALHALTGQTLWKSTIGQPTSATPSAGNGRLFVPTLGVKALDVETGKVVWSHDEGSFVTSSPSYAAGMLVVGGGDDPGIEGLTAQTGARVWFVPTRLFVRGAPIIANDAAIATADDGSILAMRLRNGSLLWTLDAGERIHGSPAVVEGKVIVGRMDGILRAYGDEALAAASTGSSTAAVAGSGDGTGGLLGMLPIAVALGVPYLALRWARDRMRTRLAAKNAAPTDARAAGVAAMLGLSGAVAGSSAPPVVKVHCPRCSCRFGIEAKEQNIIECPACGLRSEVRRRRSARPGPSG